MLVKADGREDSRKHGLFESNIQNTHVLRVINEQHTNSRKKGLVLPSHHLV